MCVYVWGCGASLFVFNTNRLIQYVGFVLFCFVLFFVKAAQNPPLEYTSIRADDLAVRDRRFQMVEIWPSRNTQIKGCWIRAGSVEILGKWEGGKSECRHHLGNLWTLPRPSTPQKDAWGATCLSPQHKSAYLPRQTWWLLKTSLATPKEQGPIL